MGTNPSKFKGADRPVDNVSWEDAQAFIQKLNAKEGHNRYRLPTEAEWEYAARAGWIKRYGNVTIYTFGDDPAMLTDYAWYDANAGGETHPVGQKRPNPWGLYDMHGNVGEWVQDWMGDYEDKNVVDPQGPQWDGSNSWEKRAFRGGSWAYGARDCRSAARNAYRPDQRNDFIGFRLALTPDQ